MCRFLLVWKIKNELANPIIYQTQTNHWKTTIKFTQTKYQWLKIQCLTLKIPILKTKTKRQNHHTLKQTW